MKLRGIGDLRKVRDARLREMIERSMRWHTDRAGEGGSIPVHVAPYARSRLDRARIRSVHDEGTYDLLRVEGTRGPEVWILRKDDTRMKPPAGPSLLSDGPKNP